MTTELAEKYAKRLMVLLTPHLDETIPEVFQTAKAGISKLNNDVRTGLQNLQQASLYLLEIEKAVLNITKTLRSKAKDGRNLAQIFRDYIYDLLRERNSEEESLVSFTELKVVGRLLDACLQLLSGLEYIRTIDEQAKRSENRRPEFDRAILNFATDVNDLSEQFQLAIAFIIAEMNEETQKLLSSLVDAWANEPGHYKFSSRLLQNMGLPV